MKTSKQYPAGWTIENTGGNCQWLRKDRIAITDGEAGLPKWGQPCVIVTLDANGSYDESMPMIDAPSLEAAFADVNAMERFYGRTSKTQASIYFPVQSRELRNLLIGEWMEQHSGWSQVLWNGDHLSVTLL